MSHTISQLRLVLEQLLCYKVPSRCNPAEGDKRRRGLHDRREKRRLLTVDEVPDVMKEPYIYTGYRQLDQPWAYYAGSVFTVHNESANVWSHGLGFLLVGCSLVNYLYRNWSDTHSWWPVAIFGVCSLAMLALSSIAHLFHSKSRWYHFAFFLLDYMGVTIYAFGSGVCSMFVCSSTSFHEAFSDWFLVTNVILSWFAFFACCAAKVTLAHNNSQRKGVMVVGVSCQAVVTSLPAASRIVESALTVSLSETLHDVGHILVVFVLLVLSGVTFAGHAPESLWPGRFDVWGHGHQWFHAIVVVGMLTQVRSIGIDVNELGVASKLTKQASPAQLIMSLTFLVVMQGVTLIFYMRRIILRRLSADTPRQIVKQKHLYSTHNILQEADASDVQSFDHVKSWSKGALHNNHQDRHAHDNSRRLLRDTVNTQSRDRDESKKLR